MKPKLGSPILNRWTNVNTPAIWFTRTCPACKEEFITHGNDWCSRKCFLQDNPNLSDLINNIKPDNSQMREIKERYQKM